jgi:hypothetical protein
MDSYEYKYVKKKMNDPFIKIDLHDFRKSAQRLVGRLWPNAIVSGVSKSVDNIIEADRKHMKHVFDLRSNWVLQGVKGYPLSLTQKSASAKRLLREHEFDAAVYLRGSSTAKNDLGFIAEHEFGVERRSKQGKNISIPLAVKQYSFRTSRGAVRKYWKPGGNLLKRYRDSGSHFENNTTKSASKQKSRRLPSKAFLIGTKGRIFIVRRIAKKTKKNKDALQFLYVLFERVHIRKTMHFIPTTYAKANIDLPEQIKLSINRLPKKI